MLVHSEPVLGLTGGNSAYVRVITGVKISKAMTQHHAQVKRVALVDFEEIKDDIRSHINRVGSDFESFLFEKPKKSPAEIEQEKRRLCTHLAHIEDVENVSKQEPQFYSAGEKVPWDINRYCLVRSYKKECHYAVFHDLLYECSGPYRDDEFKMLVRNEYDQECRYFKKLHSLREDNFGSASSTIRERIPEKIRIAVWRRDGGKCSRCESREKIEFDHIVPISLGGSNTARNIELLCERCNRTKGASIR